MEAGDGLEIVAARFLPDGAVDVPFEALHDVFRAVICETLATCGCGATRVADCEARPAWEGGWATDLGLGTPELADAIASGVVHYDAAAAGRVVAMFRAAMATCEVSDASLFTRAFAANGVLRGPGSVDAGCRYSYECGAGLECRYLGDFVSECRPLEVPDCAAAGLCRERPTWGSRLACAGAACDQGVPPGVTPPATRRCRWSTRLDGVCACEPAVGAPCGTSLTCGSGYCASGACAPRTRALGEACTDPQECAGGVCLDGACAPVLCATPW